MLKEFFKPSLLKILLTIPLFIIYPHQYAIWSDISSVYMLGPSASLTLLIGLVAVFQYGSFKDTDLKLATVFIIRDLILPLILMFLTSYLIACLIALGIKSIILTLQGKTK